MADLSDVETALEAVAETAAYPTGAFPAASLLGYAVRVDRGWPTAAQLDSDRRAGIAVVTIFPLPTSRNTTRWFIQQSAAVPTPITITATLSGRVVTFGGTVTSGQVIGVECLGIGYAYRALSSDTLASIAAAFASEITGSSAAGALLTLPSDVHSGAAVVSDAAVSTEYGRIEHEFQISLWCPSWQSRDSLGSLLMRAIIQTTWLTLPLNETGRLRYRADVTSDKAENGGQFRRDIRISVEYPVSVTKTLPTMLFGIGRLLAPAGGVITTFGVQLPAALAS